MVFFLLDFGHPDHKKNISFQLPQLVSSPADSCGFIYPSVRYMSLWFTWNFVSAASLSFAFIGLSKNVKHVPGVYRYVEK